MKKHINIPVPDTHPVFFIDNIPIWVCPKQVFNIDISLIEAEYRAQFIEMTGLVFCPTKKNGDHG